MLPCLFLAALRSTVGKGLTSWFSRVFLSLSHTVSWIRHAFLLFLVILFNKRYTHDLSALLFSFSMLVVLFIFFNLAKNLIYTDVKKNASSKNKRKYLLD